MHESGEIDMTETIHPLISLALLAWAVISVIWLTLAVGSARSAREDVRVLREAKSFYQDQVFKREDRIAELVQANKDLRSQHEWNILGNAVLAELEESVRQPSYRKLVSNTDKVLDYYRDQT